MGMKLILIVNLTGPTSHLGDKPLGMPVRDCFIGLIEVGRSILKVGGTILWAWVLDCNKGQS